LVELWAFEGMLSSCNWFLNNDLFLQTWSQLCSDLPCCWEAIEFTLLLVAVLLNYELYWQSYSGLKVGWDLEVDFKTTIYFLHILRVDYDPILWYAYCWKVVEVMHHLVVVLLNFELFWQRYANNGWCKKLHFGDFIVVGVVLELVG
jgi:hypothetical protein